MKKTSESFTLTGLSIFKPNNRFLAKEMKAAYVYTKSILCQKLQISQAMRLVEIKLTIYDSILLFCA